MTHDFVAVSVCFFSGAGPHHCATSESHFSRSQRWRLRFSKMHPIGLHENDPTLRSSSEIKPLLYACANGKGAFARIACSCADHSSERLCKCWVRCWRTHPLLPTPSLRTPQASPNPQPPLPTAAQQRLPQFGLQPRNAAKVPSPRSSEWTVDCSSSSHLSPLFWRVNHGSPGGSTSVPSPGG